jgi:hypothetical protein
MPVRPGRWPHIDRERLPLDEAFGQYLLKQPIVRAAREHPRVAVLWIVVGLAVALSYAFDQTTALVLLLVVGLPVLLVAQVHVSRRPERPSKPTDGLRLTLIIGWVAAAFGVIAVIAWLETATGYTGVATVVVMFVALPILGKLLQAIFRV